MKYLKAVNESIGVDKIDDTIKWIKERVGYSEMVGIFNEIKVVFDDVGDFKWYSDSPNVNIKYSYLAGKRNMKGEFYLASEYVLNPEHQNTIRLKDQLEELAHINRFLDRIESLTIGRTLSIETQMSLSQYSSQTPSADYNKWVTEAFTSPVLETIQSAEDIEIRIEYKYKNYTLSEFIDFLVTPVTGWENSRIDRSFLIRISFTKDLPNNIFSDGDSTPPEKLPESIIKDFTEFTNKIRLSSADKKELIRLINRGISERDSDKKHIS